MAIYGEGRAGGLSVVLLVLVSVVGTLLVTSACPPPPPVDTTEINLARAELERAQKELQALNAEIQRRSDMIAENDRQLLRLQASLAEARRQLEEKDVVTQADLARIAALELAVNKAQDTLTRQQQLVAGRVHPGAERSNGEFNGANCSCAG